MGGVGLCVILFEATMIPGYLHTIWVLHLHSYQME